MRAWRVHELGDPSAMTLDEVPVPTPGDGRLLVRVRAAAVNFPDVLMATGRTGDGARSATASPPG